MPIVAFILYQFSSNQTLKGILTGIWRAYTYQFLLPFLWKSLQIETMWWLPFNFRQPHNLIAALPYILTGKLVKCDYFNCPELMRKDQRPNTSWRLNDTMGHGGVITHGFQLARLQEEWASHWVGEKCQLKATSSQQHNHAVTVLSE